VPLVSPSSSRKPEREVEAAMQELQTRHGLSAVYYALSGAGSPWVIARRRDPLVVSHAD
jgi:hypothetical protein